jgi:hypothetical protein
VLDLKNGLIMRAISIKVSCSRNKNGTSHFNFHGFGEGGFTLKKLDASKFFI